MRFYKVTDAAEHPEKSGNSFFGIRSAIRIDLRPHERMSVATDLGVEWAKNERVKIVPEYGEAYFLEEQGSLRIDMYNPTEKSIQLYPGSVIASAEVYKTVRILSEILPVNSEELSSGVEDAEQ